MMDQSSVDQMEFPEPNIPFYQKPQTVGAICFSICFILLVIYKGGKVFFTRFYSLPPDKYVESIKEAYNGNGLVKESKVGIKKASFRRRLILASVRPQQYSTVPLVTRDDTDCSDAKYQQIRVAKVDKEENPDFISGLKPMDPKFPKRKILYGFFHPYSYAGGGGEMVLWQAVYDTLKADNHNVTLVYTFTETNSQSVSSLLTTVHQTFGINFFEKDIKDRIVFMQLPNKYRWIVDGRSYKFLTMFFQAIGSFVLFFIAMNQCAPDIFIDTLGLPFSYPPARMFLQIPVYAYVHYPWVSSDMLNKIKIKMRKQPLLIIKYIYWYILMKLYSMCGSFLSCSSCNSSWTRANLLRVWTWADDKTKPNIIYPPTGIDETAINIVPNKSKTFLYIAQFRPEKRHELLIHHYLKYVEQCRKQSVVPYKLVLLGTTRSEKDETTVRHLKKLIGDEKSVIIKVNAPREEVDQYLSTSEYGLNTMWNEHFGISVVEYMLYGAIPIVHASGGPRADICVPISGGKLVKSDRKELQSGLFFEDPSDPDFSKHSTHFEILSSVFMHATIMSEQEKTQYRKNAMLVAKTKFGASVFQNDWNHVVAVLASYEMLYRSKRGKVEMIY